MKNHYSVGFYYGFSEGPWHSKRFRRSLKKHGFIIAKDVHAADIVITHSAGSYFVPELQSHQILFMINPTYWPGKGIMRRAIKKILQDFRVMVHPGNFIYSVRKLTHNFWYGVVQQGRSRHIIKLAREFDLAARLHHKNSIIIRNDGDPWLTPDLGAFAAQNPSIKIHHIEGDHDHCWRAPKLYIEIIQKTLHG